MRMQGHDRLCPFAVLEPGPHCVMLSSGLEYSPRKHFKANCRWNYRTVQSIQAACCPIFHHTHVACALKRSASDMCEVRNPGLQRLKYSHDVQLSLYIPSKGELATY
jgi:hypothetical protein